jgi:hypothetical protein
MIAAGEDKKTMNDLFWFILSKDRPLQLDAVGICSVEPQIVNLAINRVSEEQYLYPHGTATADTLLGAWESGYQLSLSTVSKFAADSCHIICDIPLEKKP